jgi:hypothetical protein
MTQPMLKTASFAALTLLLNGLIAAAAPRPENSTYIDGTVAALKPNTGGTLVFSDKDAMLFKTPMGEVAVPYTRIQRAELGAAQAHPNATPAYKVWTLPRRLHRNETQLLTVEFKNKAGEDQLMKFELAKPAASNVLAEIQDRTAKKASASSQAWWGDSIWKTQRNASTWDNQSASVHE